VKIVPAILSEGFEDFLFKLHQAESFARCVQVDIMDGEFVPTRSFPPEMLNTVNSTIFFEIHLMVKDPSSVMDRVENKSIKKVLFHFESDVDHMGFIGRLRQRGLRAGLAVKPETGLAEIKDVAVHADTLMFLTVDPCCYGNPLRPEVLGKVAEARRLFPGKTISVDGGVSLDNLRSFMEIGVDYVCVGSRIFLNGSPEENYRLFLEKVDELQRTEKGP
jgi:ribulose-phosphate 3-epimerase